MKYCGGYADQIIVQLVDFGGGLDRLSKLISIFPIFLYLISLFAAHNTRKNDEDFVRVVYD
jgi:hypothetical protein